MNDWWTDEELLERVRKLGFYYRGRHLPYNPNLVERARKLRKNMTGLEKRLWIHFFKDFPVRVLRQRPIDNFIVDFYCPKAKLVIEIDGPKHRTNEGRSMDAGRTMILEWYGLKVIRFNNISVARDFEKVCEEIRKEINNRIHNTADLVHDV